MTGDELRAAQMPLKAKYKESPEAAFTTLRAKGTVTQDTLSFALETGKPGVAAGLHALCGGTGAAACSADMLLEALASCAGVTLAVVATSMGIVLTSAQVTAEGDLDFRGTLGVSKEVPVGFQRLRLIFTVASEAPREKLMKLGELSERYCVVSHSLSKDIPLEVSVVC